VVNTTVNGVAMAGPVSGQVCAYALNAAGSVGTTTLDCANTTPATGAFSLTIPDYVGNIILLATGTYIDEATGQTITLANPNALRAATGWDTAGQTISVAITPLTEAALRAAQNAGGLTEANILAAMLNLANALDMGAANGDAAYDLIAGLVPTLSGGSNAQLAYAAFLDLFSTAQSQHCGSNSGCTLFSYLDHVLGQIGSQTGTNLFRQSLEQAYTAWQAAQADAPYVCSYTGGEFICVPNTGGGGNNGGGNNGGSGNFNLTIIVSATTFGQTVSETVRVTDIDKPSNQSEFCDPVKNPILASRSTLLLAAAALP
jgi:hypothetical protein